MYAIMQISFWLYKSELDCAKKNISKLIIGRCGLWKICFEPLKLFVDVPATIHDAHNRNSSVLLVRNIENKVVVYWHDAHIALVPVLFIICTITFRHLIERSNSFLDAGKLTVCILHRPQLHCDVSENLREVSLSGFC